MAKTEFFGTLKYNLDLRLKGNHCPWTFCAHSDLYSDRANAVFNASAQERREAFTEFLDYALSKPEVRVVSNKELLDWLRKPVTF